MERDEGGGGGEEHFAFNGLFNSICVKLAGRLADWCLDPGSRGNRGEKRRRKEENRHRGGFKLDI